MVNFEEISVVVSGPVIFVENNEGRFNATSLGCKSIRKRLPGAEIVFSTWENEDVSEIDYDILVRSEDVGGGQSKRWRQYQQADMQQAGRHKSGVTQVCSSNEIRKPYSKNGSSQILGEVRRLFVRY